MAVSQRIRSEFTEALSLILHGQRIGILVHYSGGRNRLTFDPEYRQLSPIERPTFTLTQMFQEDYLEKRQSHSQRLSPVLSNLLPEGALREWLSSTLKTHTENEFPLLAWTGENLPGALAAHSISAGQIPAWALSGRGQIEPVQIDVRATDSKFSLAGVQMKFSSVRRDGRFNIGAQIGADSWIIKTPSTVHRNVPENEFSAMKLAESIGVHIPDIQLIPLEKLDNLPDIVLPNESMAFGIRRFDRSGNKNEKIRIHAEDFAQIFELYAHKKYHHANYEQIGRIIYQFGQNGLADLQQMTRRLLANILLANGDAHLKNWSMIYPDRIHPQLSPAYDIVTTLPYVRGETGSALNMGKEKVWKNITMDTFRYWSTRIGAPWPAIKVHLDDALETARAHWPTLIRELPMMDAHKVVLREHLAGLSPDMRIEL
ncbi:type II toxin-antitoxin system HipA family toxin [Endozoicomonas sp. 4G]|uniref:type II toxin-antitoxin system HipA family toxin n=1 Tax=Endozoicomonas sp. 4G TaxID=2872754 RepID=UPI002078DED7|nr:type II toxin-antitoxin system HipA family toxin [Endozoicomonas sp. 4G]